MIIPLSLCIWSARFVPWLSSLCSELPCLEFSSFGWGGTVGTGRIGTTASGGVGGELSSSCGFLDLVLLAIPGCLGIVVILGMVANGGAWIFLLKVFSEECGFIPTQKPSKHRSNRARSLLAKCPTAAPPSLGFGLGIQRPVVNLWKQLDSMVRLKLGFLNLSVPIGLSQREREGGRTNGLMQCTITRQKEKGHPQQLNRCCRSVRTARVDSHTRAAVTKPNDETVKQAQQLDWTITKEQLQLGNCHLDWLRGRLSDVHNLLNLYFHVKRIKLIKNEQSSYRLYKYVNTNICFTSFV